MIDSETKKVIGLEVNKFDKIITVYSNKEVIISARAFGTPKLLMLSGIGPKDELAKFDIEIRKELPVGQNLFDHLVINLVFVGQGGLETTIQNLYGLKELSMSAYPVPVLTGYFSLKDNEKKTSIPNI